MRAPAGDLATAEPDSAGRRFDVARQHLEQGHLPAPFGPITAWIPPVATSSATSRTARSPPKRFDSFSVRSRISGSAIGGELSVVALQGVLQSGNPVQQSQYDGDHEEAHRQQPMRRQTRNEVLKQHQHEGADRRAEQRPHPAHHDDDKGDAAKAAPEAKTKPCTSPTSTPSAWVISRLAAPARIIMPSLVLWITRYIATAIKRQEPEATRR